MNQLIQIVEQNGQNVVDARQLHAYLESNRQFANWISYRISQFGLTEGVDYVTLNKIVKRASRKEYALTLTCAKELAMVEGNAKGKAARLYFIECERRAKEAALLPRVVLLETEVADLKQEVVGLKAALSKPLSLRPAYAQKQLVESRSVLTALVRKHFGPPAHDQHTLFLSTTEVVAYLKRQERLQSLPTRLIAQTLIALTGVPSTFRNLNSHCKRGYWLQLLTTDRHA